MLNVCQAADSDIHWSAQMVCRTSTRGKCSSQSYCSRSCSLHVTNSIRKSKEWKCRSEKKRGRKCYTGAFASERLSEGCKMLMWLPLLGAQAEHTHNTNLKPIRSDSDINWLQPTEPRAPLMHPEETFPFLLFIAAGKAPNHQIGVFRLIVQLSKNCGYADIQGATRSKLVSMLTSLQHSTVISLT